MKTTTYPLTAPQTIRQQSASLHAEDALQDLAAPALALVAELCEALDRDGIRYCHWKSNNALDRSASGDNDLDLLVSRADEARFTQVLSSLGFKRVKSPPERQMPGVLDYLGFDPQAQKIVHVHAHYQLSLGDDLTKNYRLPVEEAYIDSSVQGNLFRVPAPEFELIVFVIRMVLKHASWDAMLFGYGRLKPGERRELTYLLERITPARVEELVEQHLPAVGSALFERCLGTLRTTSSVWQRISTGLRLQRALSANALHPMVGDSLRKVWRRVYQAVRRRVRRSSPKFRPENGGLIVALVGGDGAGKSTAIEATYDHFSRYFDVARFHMGKPSWSPVTFAVRAFLRAGRLLRLYPPESSFAETLAQQSPVSPGYPWLAREVCRARDRYGTYVKARRHAARGGIVLLDRFPVSQLQLMDGPQGERFVVHLAQVEHASGLFRPRAASRLTGSMIRLEQGYYRRMSPPDLLLVLRVEPEVAVRRKTEEDPSQVLVRSTEVWEADWDGTDATVIDAGKSQEQVAAEVTSLIWAQL
ncbi:MAG TPA: hypothetical protein VFR15_04435 [Chloroflexia bacterium]|nr:hypothetical protein [Chloroflexia bacterium]